jgi:type IV fimbrial biogenesis protein FimT
MLKKIRNKGFTLIELMIAITIMGIIAAMTYPSFSSLWVSNRLYVLANNLVSTIDYARFEAQRQNGYVGICSSSDSSTCSGSSGTSGNWTNNYFVYQDSNSNQVFDSNERIMRIVNNKTKQGDVISSTQGNIIFDGLGQTTATTFTVCNSKSTVSYQITLSSSGMTDLSQISNASCTS